MSSTGGPDGEVGAAGSAASGGTGASAGRGPGDAGNGADAGDIGVGAGSGTGASAGTDGEGGSGGSDGTEPVPGEIVWARSLSSMGVLGVDVGPGGILVAGYAEGSADLGGGPLVSVGSADGVVAGFDPTDAAHLYSTRFGNTGAEYAWVDSAADNGTPILFGVTFGDPVDLGQGAVPGGGGAGADTFIGRYGPEAPAWVHRMAGPDDDRLNATAPGPGSTVYASGSFTGTTTLDGDTYTSAGARDIFLAAFNGITGEVGTVATFGSSGREESSALAWSGTHLVMSGFFDGTTTFGATSLTSAGGLDVVVTKLNPNATPVWAVRFGGTGEERDSALAVDANGDVYVAGTFSDEVAFGDFVLQSLGLFDVFVIKLRGADGSVLWATSIGSVENDACSDMALTAADEPVLAGHIGGSLDGNTDTPYAGALDAYLIALDAAGARRWTRMFGTASDDRGTSVATDAGAVYFGVSSRDLDPGVPVIGEMEPASLLLKLNP